MPAARPRFWPWAPKAALIVAVLLLLTLLGLLLASRHTSEWPADGDLGPVLLAALVVAAIPVLLLVADGLAANKGSIGIAGVKVSFASTSEAVAAELQTTTLTQNLGTTEDDALASDSLRSILDALRKAHRSDVTVVDLARGQTWWESRLFILVAGAAQRDRPRAIAFVAEQGAAAGRFLGWAEPARLLELHLESNPELGTHHARALAEVAKWRLGSPAGSGPLDQPAVILPWGGQQYLPKISDTRTDPSFAMELYLQQALDGLPGLRRRVTASLLLELYGAELVVDAIDVSADAGAWSAVLTTTRQAYFALNDAGRFKTLVPRDTLVAALVAKLFQVTGVVDSRSG